MSQTISFKIKIEGSDSFKVVTADAGEVAEAIRKINQRTNELNGNLVNTAAAMQVVESLGSMFSGLESAIDSLTSGYRAQSEELSKLKRIMRNTMDATEDEIDSVRRLIKEQERKGVVSEEAQLAAAQELATYLTMSDSLEAIIPTMNNMIAQQLGMGASAESAAQIAMMLGKVMNGQVTALSRNGYAFSEAQQHILLYGDEMERAHVLCQVVDESVAGVNESMRQSDAGNILDISNAFNQVKDSVGQALNFLSPYLKSLAKFGQGITGVSQLVIAKKELAKMQGIVAANAKIEAAAQKMLAKVGYQAAAGTNALKAATIGLKLAIGGILIAIPILVSLFVKLANKGKDAADGVDAVTEAQEEYKRASIDIRTELSLELIKLEELIKSKKDTADMIEHLNTTYGNIFGTYETASDWYDVLTAKSAAYAKKLGEEAKQVSLVEAREKKKDEEKELLTRRDTLVADRDKYIDQYEKNKSDYDRESRILAQSVIGNFNFQLDQLDGAIKKKRKEIEDLDTEIDAAQQTINAQNDIIAQGTTAGMGPHPSPEFLAQQKAAEDAEKEAARNREKKAADLTNYKKGVSSAVEIYETFGSKDKDIKKIDKPEDDITKKPQGFKQLKESDRLVELRNSLAELIRAKGISDPEVIALSDEYKKEYSSLIEAAQNDTKDKATKFDINEIVKTVEEKKREGAETVELDAMRSGLESLVQSYGADDPQVQALIEEFKRKLYGHNAKGAHKAIKTMLPTSVTALNQPKAIIEKLPKLPEINIEDLTFEDTIMSAEDAVTALNALGSTMSSLKGIVGEGAAGWLEWGANILQAVAQALPALSTLFAANTSVAAAEGAASVASIPYVGPVMAVAAIASIVGAIASLPKFAQGGLVYGPTLGLFGEYAGASSNPEVVAPLDKLRELIAPPSSEFGKVEFVIEGRNLKGVLNRVNRMDSRNNG